MADEAAKSSFLNRLKDATSVVATRAREGVEVLQLKHELSQAYGDLGRTTADLVTSGAVSHPELNDAVAKIGELKAQLDEANAEESEAEEAKAEEPKASAEEPAAAPAEPAASPDEPAAS